MPGDVRTLIESAWRTGQLGDTRVREDIGEAHAMNLRQDQLIAHVGARIAAGEPVPASGSVARLFSARNAWHQADATLRIAGVAAATGDDTGEPGLGQAGQEYLYRLVQGKHLVHHRFQLAARGRAEQRIVYGHWSRWTTSAARPRPPSVITSDSTGSNWSWRAIIRPWPKSPRFCPVSCKPICRHRI